MKLFLNYLLNRALCAARPLCIGSAVCLGASAVATAQAPATPAAAPATNAAAPAANRIALPSGLQYEDIKVGSGMPARVGANVTVHYTGWLRNRDGSIGKKFDSSRDSGEPFQFILGTGQVIQGWDEGVQGMQVGGVRMLYVPASLGYGARGAGREIPPNAKLIFEVELLSL